MSNKKLNNKTAKKILINYFMKGGGAPTDKHLCKMDATNRNCILGDTKLRGEWCEMSSDAENIYCVYSKLGKQNVNIDLQNISRKINYNPQSMEDLHIILKNTDISKLQALGNLLNIKNTTPIKADLINLILKNRVVRAYSGQEIWSYS